MSTNVVMAENRVLIKRITLEKKTAGGIILGDITSREEDASAYGQIVGVSRGKHYDFGFVPTEYAAGDVVCYNPRAVVAVNWLGSYYSASFENNIFFKVPAEQLELLNIKNFDQSEGKEEEFSRATPLLPSEVDKFNFNGKKLYHTS